MDTLANKTALVTGASRGMGRTTALALAAAGARIIVHYGRNADEAKAVVDQIRAAGGRADAVAADLAAPGGPHALAAQVRDLIGDRLDILVSNAGISKASPLEDITVKDFDELFAVNVRAPYFLVQQLLPILGDDSNIADRPTRRCSFGHRVSRLGQGALDHRRHHCRRRRLQALSRRNPIALHSVSNP